MIDRITEQPFCQTRDMCRAVDNLELLKSQPNESVNMIYSDSEVKGGIQFSLSIGQGKEQRFSEDAEIGPSLDALLDAFGAGKAVGDIPSGSKSITDVFQYLSNALQTVGPVQEALHGDKQGIEKNDTIYKCKACGGHFKDSLNHYIPTNKDHTKPKKRIDTHVKD